MAALLMAALLAGPHWQAKSRGPQPTLPAADWRQDVYAMFV